MDPVLGAVLALCDSLGGVTGKELLLAVALGLDVSCRVALASTVDRGWHRTAAMGVFGAAAAAGKLLRYGKVFVGPVEAARGLSFDAVFVPGLAERMFPRKIVEEPILLDRLREQISGGLATNQSRIENERLALALAVGAAETRICFSYPRLDLQAQPRPRVPSFYALEALRATEGRLPDFSELARRAETATAARLGWPGPPNPVDAIDSAEHDLAILDRLATVGRPDAGAACYLVTANPHLARALRARYHRWGKSWTGSDGLVGRSEMARAVMARHMLGVRSYSPTSLQKYARCPYRFFLYAAWHHASSRNPSTSSIRSSAAR